MNMIVFRGAFALWWASGWDWALTVTSRAAAKVAT